MFLLTRCCHRKICHHIDLIGTVKSHHHKLGLFIVFVSQQDSIIRGLFGGEVSVRSAEVLGLLGTAQAQLALVEFASQPARPLKQRVAASEAFEQAVNRRGLMLRDEAIDTQYERYNKSELLDAETQGVLAHMLDTIEAYFVSQRAAAGEPVTQPEEESN